MARAYHVRGEMSGHNEVIVSSLWLACQLACLASERGKVSVAIDSVDVSDEAYEKILSFTLDVQIARNFCGTCGIKIAFSHPQELNNHACGHAKTYTCDNCSENNRFCVCPVCGSDELYT